MAYSEEVAQRFREGLVGLPEISEVKMMGGVCFLMSGNMIGGTSIQKGTQDSLFLFRVGKDNAEEALSRRGASIMMNGTRRMNGFIRVEADECSDEELAGWIALCLSFVGSLPPKEK